MDQLKLSVCTYKNEIILVTDRSRYETQFSGLTLVVSLHGSKRTAKIFFDIKILSSDPTQNLLEYTQSNWASYIVKHWVPCNSEQVVSLSRSQEPGGLYHPAESVNCFQWARWPLCGDGWGKVSRCSRGTKRNA